MRIMVLLVTVIRQIIERSEKSETEKMIKVARNNNKQIWKCLPIFTGARP